MPHRALNLRKVVALFEVRLSCCRPAFLALCLLSLCASGCAVPLGAGFRLRSRQLSFPDLPPVAGPVQLRITDRIVNTGNRALAYLDVSAPLAPARGNLSVSIDDKLMPVEAVEADPGGLLRLRFAPPWPAGSSHQVEFTYDLSTEPVRGGVAGATPSGFYLADPRALPAWLTPVGFFSSSDVLDRDERLFVTIPADFKIITSEKLARRRLVNGNLVCSFRTSGKDIPPYLIAGRYQEQTVHTPHGDVVIWTFQPRDPSAMEPAVGRLAYAAEIFKHIFGPGPDSGPLRVVEAPDRLFARDESGQPRLAAAFPAGVLLSSRAFAQGLGDDAVLRAAEAELVKAWFGWRVPLRSDGEILLGRGLGLFAVAMAAEMREGRQARRGEIVRLLREYDRLRLPGGGEYLLQPPELSTARQLAANSRKSALFLAGLDDLGGDDRFEMALRRLQDSMAGRGIYLYLDDLRAAFEGSIGRPVPGFFRQWLNHPGIPDDFRARYSESAATGSNRPPALAARGLAE